MKQADTVNTKSTDDTRRNSEVLDDSSVIVVQGVRPKHKPPVFFMIMGVVAILGIVFYALRVNSLSVTTQSQMAVPSSYPMPTQVPSPTLALYSTNTFQTKPSPIPKNTPYPTPTLSPNPSPTPFVDTTGPMIDTMTGPENGSTVTFTNFCFPMKVTDNVSRYPNLWVRIKFDTTTWSAWSTDVSPCYQNVSSGNHTFSVQAKDEAGNLSQSITRSFTVQPLVVTLSGQIYSDVNCNGVKESGESSITGVTVNIFQSPGYSLVGTVTSDGSGSYTFSKNISEQEVFTLKPSPVSPAGFTGNPTFNQSVTFTNTSRNATIDVPQVPNENIGLCQV